MVNHVASSPLILSENELRLYVGGRNVLVSGRTCKNEMVTFQFAHKTNGGHNMSLPIPLSPELGRPSPRDKYISAGMVLDALQKVGL